MIFTETPLQGAYIIEAEPFEDERGSFARTWCKHEFEAHCLNARMVQCSTSFNNKKGTLRGMHYQAPPHDEAKLVRCTRGAIYDVIIDLRPKSRTFKQWVGVTITAEDHKMIYAPEGFAHGFQTLEDNTEILYQISEFYLSESSKGVRWDDPTFGIHWPPVDTRIISSRDQQYPDFIL